MNKKVRIAGWLAVAGLLAAALISPATSLAATVQPTAHEGNITNCPVGYTTILIAGPVGADTSASGTADAVTVNVTYSAGQTTIDFTVLGGVVNIAYVKGGDGYNVYDYGAAGTTGDTGLVSPLNGGENVPVVSHSVFCVTTTTTTTSSETSSTSSTTSSETSSTSSTTSSETSSTSSSTTASTTSTSSTTSSETTASTSSTSSSTTAFTPDGSVLGETGTPGTTPPPTDSMSSSQSPSSGSWSLLLFAAAVVLGAALVLTRSGASRRSK